MVKRTLALVGCLFLSAALTSLSADSKLFLTQPSLGEIIISVNPTLHQQLGLAYPVTYRIAIPPGSSNLAASIKYLDQDSWIRLTEKTSSDYFNGEQVVRFDYAGNAAYVSAGFDPSSDNIYFRITDGSDQPVNISFQNICRYYDNRQAVVTVSADDWEDYTNLAFVQSVNAFRNYQLPFTAAIITGRCSTTTWQTIQSELDSGLVEAASHTRTHTNPPYADPVSEIVGSKQDLLTSLILPAPFRSGSQGYVYTWIAPYGSTTTGTELVVSQAGYLIDRMTFSSTGNFTAWDSTQHRYTRDGKTVEMGPLFGGLTDLTLLNSLFNQAVSGGKIYHLMLHPKVLADSGSWYKPWSTGHLEYISNRTNIWYVNFGTLYLYHLLQDTAAGTIQVISGPPTITLQPVSVTARWRETATFTVNAVGSAPLAYQWQRNGTDIAGATSASYTTPPLTPADSNTTFLCVVSNSMGTATSNSATLIVLPPNILTNASFESGTSPWVFWTNGSGSLTQASSGTDGIKSAQITITAPGTDVQLYQAGLTVQPNTDYRLTFDAYSNTGHDLEVNLTRHTSPYTNYGLEMRRLDLGTSWQSFSVTFTTSGFTSTVTDGRLWFSLAAYDAAGDVYHIDNVRLARVVDLFPPESTPPGFTMQPTRQTVLVGQAATFAVTATGTAPLSYQWQKNAVNINGATASSYTTPATVTADSGALFRCRVTNNYGSVISLEAPLTVITPRPPKVTVQPRDTTVREGSPAQFAVTATGDTVLTYQWQKNGAAIAGATSATFTIGAAARTDSGAAFRCIVANGIGKDTSIAAILRVRPLPPTQFLVSPAAGSTSLDLHPVLCWRPTPGASSYHLQVSTDSTFLTGMIVDDSTVVDTTYHVHDLSFFTRYFWHVEANGTEGEFSLVWSFTTIVAPAATPILLSPLNGTEGIAVASVEFTWGSAPRATNYHLQITADSTFASGPAFDDSTLTDTIRTVGTLLTDSRYYWRVSARGPGGAGGFSVVWSFETVKTAPLAAGLIAPANGASGVPAVGLVFRWNKVLSATRYDFQLSIDSTFATGVVKNDTALVDTMRIVSGLTRGAHYHWRVRACNTAGWGPYSPAWTLTTIIPPPGQVTLANPGPDALANADSATFTWHRPLPDATRFWFEIGTDSTFASSLSIDSTLTDTATVVRSLQNGQRYCWRVRGGGPGGWGAFSETRMVSVAITSVAERRGVPETFELEQNHPNPFNPSTKIGFGLPVESQARIDVYNMLGQKIATILDQRMPPGYHTVTFDAPALPSGAYIYRLMTDKGAFVRKMLLMK